MVIHTISGDQIWQLKLVRRDHLSEGSATPDYAMADEALTANEVTIVSAEDELPSSLYTLASLG